MMFNVIQGFTSLCLSLSSVSSLHVCPMLISDSLSRFVCLTVSSSIALNNTNVFFSFSFFCTQTHIEIQKHRTKPYIVTYINIYNVYTYRSTHIYTHASTYKRPYRLSPFKTTRMLFISCTQRRQSRISLDLSHVHHLN